MQAYELYITVPAEHTMVLPAELPTGSRARVIVLLDDTKVSTNKHEKVLSALAHLNKRREQRLSFSSAEEIEAHIQALRNDWDDRDKEIEQCYQNIADSKE